MPTYDYKCEACGYTFEEFQSITAKPLKKCPDCGKMSLKRLIGTGAALIFKGSGFYETDYRSDSYQKAAKAESAKTDTAKPEKADSKPAVSKAESTGNSNKNNSAKTA